MIGVTKNSGSFYPNVATCQQSRDRTAAQSVLLDEGQYVEITDGDDPFYRCTVIGGKYEGWTSTWLRSQVRIISSLEALARVAE